MADAKKIAKTGTPGSPRTASAGAKPEAKTEHKGLLALIRIRGAPKMSEQMVDTLDYLNLKTRNACVLVPDTPSFRGMIKKVNSFITWGEVSDETAKQLDAKRAGPKKHAFRLHVPSKGLERKGIKLPYKAGGVLGYRGKDINELIMRMI
ncbi:uL30 family ribosomal protein [Candidatus Woesearchaeota archaeon]|nr:uL30 family ribosomal protein [Candidatus Woesearchaeota archaeon]